MRDRQPTPGREGMVRLILTSGEILEGRLEMADEPTDAGTPLNKATLLTDQTAALYPGLDGDSTLNDVYYFLGGYTQWRWNRRRYDWDPVLGDQETNVLVNQAGSESIVIKYATQITIAYPENTVELVSPSSRIVTYNSYSSDLDTTLRDKYFTLGSDPTVYYFGAGARTIRVYVGTGSNRVDIEGIQPVTADVTTGPWEEVRASTSDAYPDRGASGGYEYEALGMPLEKAADLPLSALLAMLTEQEQLRADVDFLAAMGGVEL